MKRRRSEEAGALRYPVPVAEAADDVSRALREVEERYRLLLEHGTDLVLRLAPDAAILSASPACRRLLGYEPDELAGRSGYDLLHADEYDTARSNLELILASGITAKIELRLVHRDGSAAPFEVNAKALRHPETRVATEIVFVARPIAETMATEVASPVADDEEPLDSEPPPVLVWSTDLNLRTAVTIGLGDDGVRPIDRGAIDGVLPDGSQESNQLDAMSAHSAALRGETGGFEFDWSGRRYRAIVEPIYTREGGVNGTVAVAVELGVRPAETESVAEGPKAPSIGSLAWEVATGEATWSDEIYDIAGVRRGEFEPTRAAMFQLVHPEDRERVETQITAALRDLEHFDLECRLERPDGGTRVVRAELGIVLDPDGRPLRLVGTLRDVSDQRIAEERLRESEERFRLLVEGVKDYAIVLLDPEGRVLSWNEGAQRIDGYAADEILGRHFAVFHPKGDVERGRPDQILIETVAKGSWEERGWLMRKDGSLYWADVLITVLRDEFGRLKGFARIVRDVTERKRIEDAIAYVSRQNELILNAAGEGIYGVSVDGIITFANPAAAKMLGYLPEELVGRSMHDVYRWFDGDGAAAHREDCALCEVILRGSVRRVRDEKFWRSDDATVPVDFVGTPVRQGGMVTGAVVVFNDVTERQRTETELGSARDAALESARMKSLFLANMSHEIRTPLNVILGYNSLIADRFDELGDRTQDVFLNAVSRAGKRLMDTVHSVLDISKIETGGMELRPSDIELPALLEHQVRDVEVLAREKGLSFSCDVEEPMARVRFDEYCLSNALTNLLQNAVKFTDRGGIWARLYRQENGTLAISIRDTGVGIDPGYLPRLFEPFSQEFMGYTRRFEGTGLGLALTKRYLEMNGGYVTIDSEKGAGSTFTVHFPVECELTPLPAATAEAG
ncbi:MAG: hypothetical protein QOD06_1183 [Candidatus Binatota bacterium]|nr:hypothetical protein [Candidatus Binatota bacterium]